MPSNRTKSVPTWKPYEWDEKDSDFISKELHKSREEFARLLEIGLDEEEARTLPPSRQEVPGARPFDRYMANRKGRSDFEMVCLIDVALEELALILVGFVADLANVNSLASKPRIRGALQEISNQGHITEDEIEIGIPECVR